MNLMRAPKLAISPYLRKCTIRSILWLLAAFAASCEPEESSFAVAKVELNAGSEQSCDLRLTQNHTPWCLKFWVDEPGVWKESDKVSLYLENLDKAPLEFTTTMDKPQLSIPSSKRLLIYEGTISALVMMGRREYAMMVIRSSVSRPVNARLIFTPGPELDREIQIKVSKHFNVYSL